MAPQWLKTIRWHHVPETPAQRQVSAEEDAGFWSQIWFAWLSPLMSAGFTRDLEHNDIWTVPKARLTRMLEPRLRTSFRRNVLAPNRWPLLRALYDIFKFDFWLGAVCQFFVTTLQVMAPFTMRYLIRWVQAEYYASDGVPAFSSIATGIGYVLGISAMQVLQNFASTQFYYRGTLLGGQIRSTLIALAFSKALKLSNRAKAGGEPGKDETEADADALPWRADAKGWANGRVMNLISTDTARIEQAIAIFHLGWLSVYQIILTVALLVYNLGWPALTGAAILIFGLAAVTYATRPLVASRARITTFTDQRVTLTQEIFQGIRFVKYFSWENFFLDRLKDIRASEARAVQEMHLIRCAVGGLSQFLPVMAIMVTFIVYAVVHGQLDAAVVFSSMAMLFLLRVPTNWLPVAFGSALDAVQSLRRLEDFFLAEEAASQKGRDPNLLPAVQLSHASFTWENLPVDEVVCKSGNETTRHSLAKVLKERQASEKSPENNETNPEKQVRPGQDNNKPFCFSDLSFEYQRNELVGIIGSVGSGKTSLLSALAGDMRRTGGDVRFSADRAYCPQYAWIQNATVRDNIIFGKPFDQQLYTDVLQACALIPDLQALPDGDMTEIGERGITLSGGQKQRINIARAVYSDADIVLLDDPLSAVDSHVGKQIFNEAICGLLQSKCRFLATHHLHLLSRFDKIIWMVDGRIEASGTYKELMNNSATFLNMMTSRGHDQQNSDSVDEKAPENDTEPEKSYAGDGSKIDVKKLMQDEITIIDSVPLSIYVSWLRASGSLWNGLAMLIGQCLFRASSLLGGLWLSWWVQNKYGLNLGQNIGIYAGLSLVQIVFLFSSSLITCLTCIRSSQVMSNEALWQTLRAPIAVFDTTPLGRMIYRFTIDIDVLDNNLVVAVQQLLINAAALLGSYVLIVVYFYYFIIALVAGGFMLWWCISYYRSSARELRRHHLTLDGRAFALFNEALIGAACIRAYAREQQFIKVVHDAIDDMNSAYYLTFASHNWLSVRLDIIGTMLFFVTGILVVTNSLPVSPSISGLLLTYSMAMVGTMQTVVKFIIEVNNSMSNMERLYKYTNSMDQEAPLDGAPVRPTWPEHGAIEYKAVQMRYRDGLPLVIDGFFLQISGGEKIGIVGRTGAGKSTILSTLFRLTETSGGYITIDGVDISKIGLHRLRSSLAIIPQDPTLFRGTIRSNIDPFNRHTDMELWDALRQAHLNPASSPANPEKGIQGSNTTEGNKSDHTIDSGSRADEGRESRVTLDAPVEAEGLNFSLGQRQLIALARALLRDTKIVLIDEGTSSVDPDTDARVQETLATGLQGKTLIAIAHRLRTILQYDRVCVMDKGEIVELGAPLDLWDRGGMFRGMCDSNGIKREMFIRPIREEREKE